MKNLSARQSELHRPFQSTIRRAEIAILRLTAKNLPMFSPLTNLSFGNLSCPDCGAELAQLPEALNQVVTCNKCGSRASAAEWRSTANEKVYRGRADSPPVTNIRKVSTPDKISWEIPANGKFGFFMAFAVIWCAVTGLLSGSFLSAVISGKEIKGNMPDWMLIPFFGIFWIVGLGMLYVGIRQKWLRQCVAVANGELVLMRELFGHQSEKRLKISDVKSIEQTKFYEQNNKPIHGIEIKASKGKLRFGSSLTPEEKAWLVADLRGVVFGSKPAVSQATLLQRKPGHFSIEIPGIQKHLWPLAIMLSLMGGASIFIGVKFMGGPSITSSSDGPKVIRDFSYLFDRAGQGFQILWICMAAAMAIGGIYLTFRLLRDRGLVNKLEGTPTQIVIRSYRDGRVSKEKVFSRQQISDIRASVSGSSNGKPMKRLELIAGNKAESLARWIDGDAADSIVETVRANL